VDEEHVKGVAGEAKGALKGEVAVNAARGDQKDGKGIEARARAGAESFDEGTGSLPELRKASEDLKTKIAEAKLRNDLPVDPALGNPEWERNVADGHVDIPDRDDD